MWSQAKGASLVTPLRQRMLEDLQIRNYSPTTVRIYLHCVQAFAQHFGSAPDRLGPEHIRRYQLFLVQEKQVWLPTYISRPSAPCASSIPTPSTGKSPSNASPFRAANGNCRASRAANRSRHCSKPRTLRQRALLAILYGSGLRVSEAIELKVSDIDAPGSVLWVRQGKGRRDRQTLLSPKLLDRLRAYYAHVAGEKDPGTGKVSIDRVLSPNDLTTHLEAGRLECVLKFALPRRAVADVERSAGLNCNRHERKAALRNCLNSSPDIRSPWMVAVFRIAFV